MVCFGLERAEVLPYVHVRGGSGSWGFGARSISDEECETGLIWSRRALNPSAKMAGVGFGCDLHWLRIKALQCQTCMSLRALKSTLA